MAAVVKSYQTSVAISAVGEITGETLAGTFIFKTRLSHRERLQIDTVRRQYLGPQPDGAVPSDRAQSSATVFANLQVRVIEGPSWWTNNGVDLADDEILEAVFDAAIKAESDQIKSVKDAAEKAKKELQKDADIAPAA